MDRKRFTSHAVAVLAGAALVLMLGAGQPAGKVCVGVSAVYEPSGGVVFVRAFSDGAVEYTDKDAKLSGFKDANGRPAWRAAH